MGITNNIPPSRLIQPGVIDNAAARPASPFEGQCIFQKDTDEILAYDGTVWTRPRNMPWGVVALTQSSTADVTITAEEVQITSSSFTAIANRYYRITYFEPQLYSPTLSCIVTAIIRKGTTTAGTQLVQTAGTMQSGTQYMPLTASVITTLTAGAQQVCATLSFTAGTGQTTRSGIEYAYLLIEDIGPA